jgi:hypothetical protein
MEGHGSIRTWPRLFFQSCACRVFDTSMGVFELFFLYCMAAWSAGCDRLIAILAFNIESARTMCSGRIGEMVPHTNSICYFLPDLSDQEWT